MSQNQHSREEVLSVVEMRDKYDTAYPDYTPDPEVLGELKSLLGDISIIIVLGTWCSDSRLQVSHFYKIADEIAMGEKSISLICVDETKKASNGLTDHLNIVSVPTFIFMKNKEEIGRIIETPKDTLERDMVQLLAKK